MVTLQNKMYITKIVSPIAWTVLGSKALDRKSKVQKLAMEKPHMGVVNFEHYVIVILSRARITKQSQCLSWSKMVGNLM